MIQFAYAADGTTAAGAGNMTSTIIMIVVMIAIFYFLLIRPENKRKKQAEEMRNSLKKGDWLTTIGGMSGDLAGFSIQMSELIMLTAYVFVSRAVNI